VEAKKDRVTRSELGMTGIRAQQTDHSVFSPNLSFERRSLSIAKQGEKKALCNQGGERKSAQNFCGYRPSILSTGYVTYIEELKI